MVKTSLEMSIKVDLCFLSLNSWIVFIFILLISGFVWGFFFFWPYNVACGILVPLSGIDLGLGSESAEL